MRIAISAPNIDEQTNVSGIVSVVRLIMQDKQNKYFHYLLGKPDIPLSPLDRVKSLIKQFTGLKRFLKTNRIDVYHQNFPYDRKGVIREAIISGLVSRTKTPILLHVHGGSYFKSRSRLMDQIARYSFKKARKVIVLSESEKRQIDATFGVKSVVIPNTVDCSYYIPKPHTYLNSTVKLLYLGRIEQNKGIRELVEALRLCKTNLLQLTICGDGPLRNEVVTECSSILGNRFQYKGVVGGKEKVEIIQEHDLFILPSYFEGLPIALLETMSCGLIPIVSKVGAIPSIVTDIENGLVLDNISAESILKKINLFIDLSSYKKDALRNNAINTIRQKYNASSYYESINLAYSEIKQSK